MSFQHSIGIYGIGLGLPETIRGNDYWTEEVRAQWPRKIDSKLDRDRSRADEDNYPGADIVLEMMAKYRDDPFKGAKYRRVLADGETTSSLEIKAAQEAIERAGIDAKDVGLYLSQSSLLDYLLSPNATIVHHQLGLDPHCTTLQTDGMCASFLLQYSLAANWLQQHPNKYALLIQSSGTTRLMEATSPMSVWAGDGAAATILGKVKDGFGIQSEAFRTYGELSGSVVAGHPEKPWFEAIPRTYIPNPKNSRITLMQIVNFAGIIASEALKKAEWSPNQVDFYACHQGFSWIREATQKYLELNNAKSVDTFAELSSLLGANIPAVLYRAQEQELLEEGDRVLTFAGATGLQTGSLTLRWGGRHH